MYEISSDHPVSSVYNGTKVIFALYSNGIPFIMDVIPIPSDSLKYVGKITGWTGVSFQQFQRNFRICVVGKTDIPVLVKKP